MSISSKSKIEQHKEMLSKQPFLILRNFQTTPFKIIRNSNTIQSAKKPIRKFSMLSNESEKNEKNFNPSTSSKSPLKSPHKFQFMTKLGNKIIAQSPTINPKFHMEQKKQLIELKLHKKNEEEEIEQCGKIRKFSINLQSTVVDEDISIPLKQCDSNNNNNNIDKKENMIIEEENKVFKSYSVDNSPYLNLQKIDFESGTIQQKKPLFTSVQNNQQLLKKLCKHKLEMMATSSQQKPQQQQKCTSPGFNAMQNVTNQINNLSIKNESTSSQSPTRRLTPQQIQQYYLQQQQQFFAQQQQQQQFIQYQQQNEQMNLSQQSSINSNNSNQLFLQQQQQQLVAMQNQQQKQQQQQIGQISQQSQFALNHLQQQQKQKLIANQGGNMNFEMIKETKNENDTLIDDLNNLSAQNVNSNSKGESRNEQGHLQSCQSNNSISKFLDLNSNDQIENCFNQNQQSSSCFLPSEINNPMNDKMLFFENQESSRKSTFDISTFQSQPYQPYSNTNNQITSTKTSDLLGLEDVYDENLVFTKQISYDNQRTINHPLIKQKLASIQYQFNMQRYNIGLNDDF